MKVATILQAKGNAVVTTHPNRKVGAVVARLNAEHIGAMIVIDNDIIVGIVSERDIVQALAAHRSEVMDLAVHEAPDDHRKGQPWATASTNVRGGGTLPSTTRWRRMSWQAKGNASVITCTSEDTIKKVMQVMTERRVRHLPVLDGGALAGIISIGDVVKNRLENLELEASVLRDAYIARR